MIKTNYTMKLALLVGLIFILCSINQITSVLAAEVIQEHDDENLMTYIVHVKKSENVASFQSEDFHNFYHSFLPQTFAHKERMVFTYRNVASGFAVKLTPEEAKSLQEKGEIVSARPERTLSLHTTHTPTFLGLKQGQGLWSDDNLGKGVIIGVIDTGIYPFHPSFNDEGMPPPPAKWRGHCEFTGEATCNNKLIGSNGISNQNQNQSFCLPGSLKNIDVSGSDSQLYTRTLTNVGPVNATYRVELDVPLALGMSVNPSVITFGEINEKVSYSVDFIPEVNENRAHNKYQEFIAANEKLEDDSNLLTYIVHVNKPSLQSKESLHGWYRSLLPDTTKSQNQQRVIFSYRNIVDGFAVKLTAEEAKSLEEKEEVLSIRPEKVFSLHTTHTPSFLGLQQNQELWQNSNLGKGIIIGVLDTGIYPLHPSFSDEGMPSPPAKWNGHCSLNTSDDSIAFCDPFSMKNVDVKGKVVLCDQGGFVRRVVKGQAVKDAGGAAMILVNSKLEAFNPIADVHVLPAVHVSYFAGLSIKDYINSTSTPKATIIFKGTVIGNPLAPQVASFSSRGSSSQFYTRTVTNVGPVNTTYNVVIDAPLAVGMSVRPSQITFTEVKQKVTYLVDFVPEDEKNRGDNMIAQGSIKWVSGKYSVSIPVSVIFV
ncbi:hypothetical protein TSUD_231050 [Trifolium subterraneum]|nr:hypothetical protein TSUD_231050 [Trifolium subterraneum]